MLFGDGYHVEDRGNNTTIAIKKMGMSIASSREREALENHIEVYIILFYT